MTFQPRMKKGRLALAALCALGAAQAALAQSSVSIYGRVTGGVEYIDKIQNADGTGTHSLTRAVDNQWGTSMLGFKGTEDLGGGLKANFLLEGGFSSKNGSFGAAFFNRRSYVGLEGGFGSLKLGKNLFISNDVWFLDPTGQQFVGSATLVRHRSWYGNDNVIEYSTPDMGGFSATLQVGLGEQPGSMSKKRNEGLSLKYAAGDLELRAIYSARRDADGKFTNLYDSSKELTVGGTYRFGPAKIFAAVDQLRAPDAAATAASRGNHGWVGVRYDLSPQLTLIGSAFRMSTNRADGKATLWMLGADYYLSKRTFFYGTFGSVSNSRGGNFAADVTVNGPGADASQRAVYVGMGHTF